MDNILDTFNEEFDRLEKDLNDIESEFNKVEENVNIALSNFSITSPESISLKDIKAFAVDLSDFEKFQHVGKVSYSEGVLSFETVTKYINHKLNFSKVTLNILVKHYKNYLIF